jgi:Peptidase C13 family
MHKILKIFRIDETDLILKIIGGFFNQKNPLPGVIRNTVNGENVYEGLNIDYAGDKVIKFHWLFIFVFIFMCN